MVFTGSVPFMAFGLSGRSGGSSCLQGFQKVTSLPSPGKPGDARELFRGSLFWFSLNLVNPRLDCAGVSEFSMPVKLDACALVSRHQVEIWRYLRFLGCDTHQAEDLAQDTFLSVLRNPIADRGRGASASYLRRVARNLLLKSKRGPVRSAREFEEMEASWQRFRREDGGNGYVEALAVCVQGLERKRRRVIQLIYWEGCSLQATAVALGLRVNGVRTLLQRVRRELRSCATRRMQA